MPRTTNQQGILLTYDLDSRNPRESQQHINFKDNLLKLGVNQKAGYLAKLMSQPDMPQSSVILPVMSAAVVEAEVKRAAQDANCKITRYAYSIGNLVTAIDVDA